MGKSNGKIQISDVYFPDTNVILRYLLKDNKLQYKKVSSIFSLIKTGEKNAILIPEVILECYYVLTKVYDVPHSLTLEKLKELLCYKGIIGKEKKLLLEAIDNSIKNKSVGLLDWILCLKTKYYNGKLLTFDEKLNKSCNNLS